jgi:hypothetical protein
METAEGRKFIGRDSFLSQKPTRTREVDIPEWGGIVRVKALSGAERDAIEQKQFDQGRRSTRVTVAGFRARLVVFGVIDEEGNRIFNESDLPAINEMDGSVIDRIATAVSELSGYTPAEVERLEGN